MVAVGLNPSPRSVAAGYYFAHPRNRFWPALNASRIINDPVVPSLAAMRILLERDRIGFTDIVKRVTASGRDLRTLDFRSGADALAHKLRAIRPNVIWFQGKTAFAGFCRYGLSQPGPFPWGLQSFCFDGTPLYVTPNPSAANAAWSLQDITRAMNAVADFVGGDARSASYRDEA